MDVALKRIYDPAEADDGVRVLVDRLWPRGVSKEKAAIDLWLKEVAPSHELRKWYGHDTARWKEFRKRYRAELDADPEPFERLVELAADERVTLLSSTRETKNHATFLAELLKKRG